MAKFGSWWGLRFMPLSAACCRPAVWVVVVCLGAWPAHAEPASERRSAVVRAVQSVSPAVVSVRTETMVQPRAPEGFDWFLRDFYGPQRKRLETLSQGSGVVIDARGYVLTNYHVIAAGGDIELELADGRHMAARVIGSTPDHDLAVLAVKDPHGVPFIEMATSYDLMIGETVIAIGNPFGLSHTVTTGVISALHRTLHTQERAYTDFIQTDASINPGNSGGPLLSIDGSLVGVTTAIYSHAQGIGFAIPIDKAKRIVSDLIKFGQVRRPYYGFEPQELNASLVDALDVGERGGAVVADVDPRGPAQPQLRAGDVVFGVDGIRVQDQASLRMLLNDRTVGASVQLEVWRGGKVHRVTLVPREVTASEAMDRLQQKAGLMLGPLSKVEAARTGLPQGLMVVRTVRTAGPAAAAGIRPGDWVRAIDSEKVLGAEAFAKILSRAFWRGQVALLIQRGRLWQQIPFEF